MYLRIDYNGLQRIDYKGFVRRSNIFKLLIITFKKEILVLCLNIIWAIRFKVCMNLILVILSATIFEYTCQVPSFWDSYSMTY